MKILFTLLFLISCGSETSSSKKAAPASSKESQQAETYDGCSVTGVKNGVLIQCADGSEAIVYNGHNGAKGAGGVKGIDGMNGIDGANGTNGVNGTNGADGADGADGVDAMIYSVEDVNGSVLGDLVTRDGNVMYVVVDDEFRATIHENGTFYSYNTYFSNNNCTGTRRGSLDIAGFGNFGIDHIAGDGTFWSYAGNNLGSFNYQSLENSNTGACDVTSGTVNNSVDLDLGLNIGLTLPIAGPVRISN